MNERLSHFDKAGRAKMVNVGFKEETFRRATACGKIFMKNDVLSIIKKGTAEKGDVLGVARIAGISAVKKTHELIPLCHPLRIGSVSIDFDINEDESSVKAVCRVEGVERTGFEMEALTGVSVALLTVYDMLKSADKSMKIGDIFLVEKSGGKSGLYRARES